MITAESLAQRAPLFAAAILVGAISGCGGDSSENPTEVRAPAGLPLRLDLAEVAPRGDVVARAGETVRFEVQLGPEHDPSALRLRWFVDDAPAGRPRPAIEVATRDLAEGVHWVRLEVSDGYEVGSVLWKLQVIDRPLRNREPLILQAIPPVGRTAVAGERVEFTAIATDPDAGDSLSYVWSLDGAEVPGSGEGAECWEIDTGVLALGTHAVEVVVADGVPRPEPLAARYRWDLEVVAADSAEPLPAYLTGAWPRGDVGLERGGRLRLEVSAEAPNPEDHLSFRWEVDGVLQESTEPFFVFEPRSEEDGGDVETRRIACWVESRSDRNADRLRAVEWTVRAGRPPAPPGGPSGRDGGEPPRWEARAPEPSVPPDPGRPIVFRVDAEDPEGDVLTYRWSVDGVPVPGGGPVFSYVPGMEALGGAARAAFSGRSPVVEVEVDDGLSESSPARARWSVPGGAGPKPVFAALALGAGAIVMDNGGAGTSSKGVWRVSGASGAYGADSVYSKTAGDTYTYRFSVANPGRYEVLLWWTEWPSRAKAVPVTIVHAAGSAAKTVEQTANGGKWNSLGTYDFSSSAEIAIASVGGDFSTCADAACLNPVSTADPPPATSGEIVIDDGASGTSSVGTWSPSSGPDPYNGRSLYAKGSGSYTFQRAIPAPAAYDVYAWWTVVASRESAVPYDIAHAGGVSTVTKDQRTDGGKWVFLGQYSFSTAVKVTVRVPGSASVCADAVRFVPAGSASPPPPATGEIILDNGMPGTTALGTWSVSGGANPYGADSLYAKSSGSYRYEIALPASGTYGVWVWYTEWPSRESAVPYAIESARGTSVVHLDQRTNGGQWRPLGDFEFADKARITVSVVDGDSVCADAVRLVPGGGAPSPAPLDPPAQTPSLPAEIVDLAAFALTPTLARVSWRTTFLGDSTVDYGKTTSLGSTRTVSGARALHSVVLRSLSANTIYYVRVRSANGTVSKTSPFVSFRTPTATPSFTVRASHPRLYFTDTEVAAIRQKILSAPFSSWWSSLKSFVGTEITKPLSTVLAEPSDYVVAAAFFGLIGDSPSARRHAIDAAVAVANQGASGDDSALRWRIEIMAPVYDWLYAYTTSGEKSAIRNALVGCARSLEGMIQPDALAVGHANGNQAGAFIAALAVYGEHSDAAGIVSRALERYHTGFWSFWREFGGEDGGSYKSTWYTTVAAEFNLRTFAVWKSATGHNLFVLEPWFGKLAAWYAYALQPDMRFAPHGDIYFSGGATESERYTFLAIARESRSGEAQWLADRVREHIPVWGPRAVWEIIWYDPTVAASKPAPPYCRHLRGPGMVFFQDAYGGDAVSATFRAPRYYANSHTHLDHCTFSIFFRRDLALDSGLYDEYDGSHWRNYYSRTIAHNGILVYDPSEVFLRYKERVAPDGGQKFIAPPEAPAAFPRSIGDLVDSDAFLLGGVAAYEEADLYAYALGDGRRAYSSSKMAAFYRHFLWLKSIPNWSRPAVVVFDEVESTNASFKKTYLLHTQAKPTVSGTLVSAANGTGMLYQRTVFPSSATISLVGGTGKEYWVKDANYPPSRPPKSGEYPGAWRVEVSPSVARTRDEFLHILYPAVTGTSAPPSARAIDAASMKGFETGNLVVLFSVRRGAMSSAKYSVSASRTHLLFGLPPARSYDVLVGGTRVASVVSSASGTLVFPTGAGTVEVVAR